MISWYHSVQQNATIGAPYSFLMTSFYFNERGFMTTEKIKKALLPKIFAAFTEYCEAMNTELDVSGERSPLAWSVFTEQYLRSVGFKDAIMRSGNLEWGKAPGDAGRCDYPAFARQFHRVSVSGQGVGKEFHCWVELPEAREIIDMTTGFIPHRYSVESGKPWPYQKPPRHLWAHSDDFTKGKYVGCVYKALPDCHKYVTADAKFQLKNNNLV